MRSSSPVLLTVRRTHFTTLLAAGRVRWINLEERRGGDRPATGWCDPQELHEFLTSNGYLRAADYNRYSTHQDAVYVHRDESVGDT